ncbi:MULTISPECIES: EF-hand domain-containing protein [unclassified Sphingomonas]|uniref:EF-hand domain-containing protein n=1 Tax=unclassified Sphingomonas TaxID=196159 RepID=UPI001F56BA74|nr:MULTISPECIES: EF-hand domain-containing protein [unclassified Sphingomonas]
MHKMLLMASALLVAVPFAASAQQDPSAVGQMAPRGAPPPGGGPMAGMMRADTNGDGKISRAEADAQASQRFDRLDLNHDGFLTADEMTGPGGRMMGRADADHDGKLSRSEYLVQAGNRFDRIDANRDGMITPDEMKAWMDRARSMMQRGGRSDPADAIAPPPAQAPSQSPPSTKPGQ